MKRMIFSRSSRLEEKKQKKRLAISIIGSIGILVFLGLFGVKLLVGFSLLVDKLRGSPQTTAPTQTQLDPPILDSIPVATKSSSLKINGIGQQGATVIIYVNDKEAKKTIVADQKGNFSLNLSGLKDGPTVISAKLSDSKGNTSILSNVLTIAIKSTPPILEITSPEDNATVSGDSNTVTVSGNTEDETTVTVNRRFVVIKTDNTFSYSYPLNEGDNLLTITGTDVAGNTTKVERKVKYQK